MKIKFLAGAGKSSYSIQGSIIDGVDLSLFANGSVFLGSEETKAAGIFDVFWKDEELHVVLAQQTSNYKFPVYSHDWKESDWIDADAYVPGVRYVVAANPDALVLIAEGLAEYALEDGKWTVRLAEMEQEPVA